MRMPPKDFFSKKSESLSSRHADKFAVYENTIFGLRRKIRKRRPKQTSAVTGMSINGMMDHV